MAESTEITELLLAWTEGEESARARLVEVVYPELLRVARRHLRNERPGHSLTPTALVHEAYLKLIDQRRLCFVSKNLDLNPVILRINSPLRTAVEGIGLCRQFFYQQTITCRIGREKTDPGPEQPLGNIPDFHTQLRPAAAVTDPRREPAGADLEQDAEQRGDAVLDGLKSFDSLDRIVDPNWSGSIDDFERREVIDHLVTSLSERERDILRLYYGRGITMREISKRVGLSVPRISHPTARGSSVRGSNSAR